MSRAILDTSISVAREQARAIERPLPAAVSVVSVAKLELGVLLASDGPTRARRLRTLTQDSDFSDFQPSVSVALV
ncbi:MAG: hypothetical protein M3Z95_03605 [Actinomycetota bacterium]|nr:hypothetical protein [Actinomycetota bacterium]